MQSSSSGSSAFVSRKYEVTRGISPVPSERQREIVDPASRDHRHSKILILDRDSMSSDLLANALERCGDCEARAIDASLLMQTLSRTKTDLVVVGADVNSTVGKGFAIADAITGSHPDIAVIILLDVTTQESVLCAFRSGARGVFSRQQPMAEFLDCVQHVRKGFIWAGKTEGDYLLEVFRRLPSSTPIIATDMPMLTAREFEVVKHAAKGKTNKQIAAELSLSEHTVKNYLFRAFEKLGVSSRVELLFNLTLKGHIFDSTEEDDLSGE